MSLQPPIVRDPLGTHELIVDYTGYRFLDQVPRIVVIDDVRDSRYFGYTLPFVRKKFRIEEDSDRRSGNGIQRVWDKFIIQEIQSKEDSETRFFKRVKKMGTLDDLRGFVRIRSAFEALEFLRLTTSKTIEVQFPGMVEIFCVADFSETTANIEGRPLASLDECRQMGFSSPEGPFDLEIADVEVKLKGTIGYVTHTTLDRLVASLKRTTTEEKEIEIKVKENRDAAKVKTKGELTQEEQALVSTLANQVQENRLKAEIRIEAKLDETKVPPFFVITRTVYSKADRGYVKVTEEVGRNGSWRILDKKMIAPLTNENFKYYSR